MPTPHYSRDICAITNSSSEFGGGCANFSALGRPPGRPEIVTGRTPHTVTSLVTRSARPVINRLSASERVVVCSTLCVYETVSVVTVP